MKPTDKVRVKKFIGTINEYAYVVACNDTYCTVINTMQGGQLCNDPFPLDEVELV